MEFVNQIWTYVEPFWAWLYAGLEAFGPVKANGSIDWVMFGIQGGIIALVMALLMQSYGAIIIFTIVGTIVHVVVDNVLPMVREGAAFTMPPFQAMDYWQYVAFLAAFYFVAITVLSIVKAILFRGE